MRHSVYHTRLCISWNYMYDIVSKIRINVHLIGKQLCQISSRSDLKRRSVRGFILMRQQRYGIRSWFKHIYLVVYFSFGGKLMVSQKTAIWYLMVWDEQCLNRNWIYWILNVSIISLHFVRTTTSIWVKIWRQTAHSSTGPHGTLLDNLTETCWLSPEMCAFDCDHRPRSSVNFRGARHFCPKNMYEKFKKWPNFSWFLPEKLSPKNYHNIRIFMIFARKINKISNCAWFCPKNARIFT